MKMVNALLNGDASHVVYSCQSGRARICSVILPVRVLRLHIDTAHDEFDYAIWEEALELHQGLVAAADGNANRGIAFAERCHDDLGRAFRAVAGLLVMSHLPD